MKIHNTKVSAPTKLSAATLSRLAKLGIHHRSALLLHLPLRYEDETRLTPIGEVYPGLQVQIQGCITHQEISHRPRKALICRLQDTQGCLTLRFLNFYPSQQQQLAIGKQVRAIGEVREGYYGLEMVHPKCRNVKADSPLPANLTPVYPTTSGLTQAALRKLIDNAFEVIQIQDTLPDNLRQQQSLMPIAQALHILHHPTPDIPYEQLEYKHHPAWQRIKFDELLAQQLSMRIHHRDRQKRHSPPLPGKHRLTQQLCDALPFTLTQAQQKVFAEISQDMSQTHPMQRLLLGDVGSGKTIVAALAALQAIENGYQVALMAPTEILAEQHYLKLNEWLNPLEITPVWLSGSQKKKARRQAIEKIGNGETRLAIGTHALFQQDVEFQQLGLAIIDEQHKFGVQQRLALHNKGKNAQQEPHQLMMSATPIPRTLAMSYYADLDVSTIDQLPPGRTPITTKLINADRRDEVFERVRSACAAGRQAYWVCPLIDESEALQLQTAIDTHQQLQTTFPELQVGLAHGKQDNQQKAAVMAAFKANQLQLLVATTVIEVGVDVPNASLMVIDHAERMGLAQLHQLRGRVGRGAEKSTCILMFQPPLSAVAKARLKVIYENSDGFEIAQQDLILRGPGELLGARQSGAAMLRFADINEDEALLQQAQQLADQLLQHYPQAADNHLKRWMADKHDYLHA